MSISKITPIIIVESVEKNLPFWQEQLGYELAHTVPHHDSVGFAILKREESEIMLQSTDSFNDDLNLNERLTPGTVVLYADTKSLDEAIKANKDGKVLIAKRETPYGATEAWIKTPSGTILGLSEFK